MPISGFEPRTSGIGSDCSTNWATTTAPRYLYFMSTKIQRTFHCLLQLFLTPLFQDRHWKSKRSVKIVQNFFKHSTKAFATNRHYVRPISTCPNIICLLSFCKLSLAKVHSKLIIGIRPFCKTNHLFLYDNIRSNKLYRLIKLFEYKSSIETF